MLLRWRIISNRLRLFHHQIQFIARTLIWIHNVSSSTSSIKMKCQPFLAMSSWPNLHVIYCKKLCQRRDWYKRDWIRQCRRMPYRFSNTKNEILDPLDYGTHVIILVPMNHLISNPIINILLPMESCTCMCNEFDMTVPL